MDNVSIRRGRKLLPISCSSTRNTKTQMLHKHDHLTRNTIGEYSLKLANNTDNRQNTKHAILTCSVCV